MIKQNYAFISYNHHDVKWAKWLRRKLEWYRLPSEIHNEFEDSRYIRPVFRDRDELNSGVLNDELRQRLEASKYLIVICSPHAALSQWVSDEVQAFIDMGRLEYIIPFIVEGDETSFPASLKTWNEKHSDRTLLGIAVNDDGEANKQKAFIRLVSRMLGVEFDTLWQRHRREIMAIASFSTVVCTVLLTLAYWFMTPINMNIYVADEKCNLPGMESGVLCVEGEEYSIASPDTLVTISALPGYYRMKPIDLSFKANRFYEQERQTVKVTAGLSQSYTLQLHRDSTFAVFSGTVSNDIFEPLACVTVKVGDKETQTDESGRFVIAFPVEEQTETKSIRLSRHGYKVISREDECPGTSLKYIMHK